MIGWAPKLKLAKVGALIVNNDCKQIINLEFQLLLTFESYSWIILFTFSAICQSDMPHWLTFIYWTLKVTQSTHVRLGELDIGNANDGANHEDVQIEQVHLDSFDKFFKWANPGLFLFIFVFSTRYKSKI